MLILSTVCRQGEEEKGHGRIFLSFFFFFFFLFCFRTIRNACQGFLLFDAVCTLPVWLNPAQGEPARAHEIYLWTHARLTRARLGTLGWTLKSDLSNQMEMYYSPTPHTTVSREEWMLFLEELFLLCAFPAPRKSAFTDVVSALTFGSLAAVIKAAVAVPFHWSEGLIDKVMNGTLDTTAAAPMTVPEIPSLRKGIRSRLMHDHLVSNLSICFDRKHRSW